MVVIQTSGGGTQKGRLTKEEEEVFLDDVCTSQQFYVGSFSHTGIYGLFEKHVRKCTLKRTRNNKFLSYFHKSEEYKLKDILVLVY